MKDKGKQISKENSVVMVVGRNSYLEKSVLLEGELEGEVVDQFSQAMEDRMEQEIIAGLWKGARFYYGIKHLVRDKLIPNLY